MTSRDGSGRPRADWSARGRLSPLVPSRQPVLSQLVTSQPVTYKLS